MIRKPLIPALVPGFPQRDFGVPPPGRPLADGGNAK